MRLPLAIIAALTFAPPIHAEHCWTWSSSPHDAHAGGVYVDTDMCQLDGQCAWGVWIYQESNGLDGLQRKDAHVDDTCHGLILADTLVL